MATWEDVRRIALGLPETSEGTSWGKPAWTVKDKAFAWERPLGKSDRKAFGDTDTPVPEGPILGARVPDLGAKDALLADDPAVYFTIPHFNGYPAILVLLDDISEPDLTELLTEAWLTRAPKRLAAQFLKDAR